MGESGPGGPTCTRASGEEAKPPQNETRYERFKILSRQNESSLLHAQSLENVILARRAISYAAMSAMLCAARQRRLATSRALILKQRIMYTTGGKARNRRPTRASRADNKTRSQTRFAPPSRHRGRSWADLAKIKSGSGSLPDDDPQYVAGNTKRCGNKKT